MDSMLMMQQRSLRHPLHIPSPLLPSQSAIMLLHVAPGNSLFMALINGPRPLRSLVALRPFYTAAIRQTSLYNEQQSELPNAREHFALPGVPSAELAQQNAHALLSTHIYAREEWGHSSSSYNGGSIQFCC